MAFNQTFSINGREYPITDHTYDVVVVGAGGHGHQTMTGTEVDDHQTIMTIVGIVVIDGGRGHLHQDIVAAVAVRGRFLDHGHGHDHHHVAMPTDRGHHS